MPGPTRFTVIEVGGYRDQAACAGRDPKLWDAEATADQHAEAKAICWDECPVRAECADDVDPRLDEGVRGGHVLPRLHAVFHNQGSSRDTELVRLLRTGVPLDEAVPRVELHARRPGPPPKEQTA